jgi:GTPase SAR1 family protein
LRENAEQKITVMLVGNKSDLVDMREVKAELVEDYVDKNKLYYL